MGAGMIAQAQGDIAVARRTAGAAYTWLASLPQATPAAQIPQLALAGDTAAQPVADSPANQPADDSAHVAEVSRLKSQLAGAEAESADLREKLQAVSNMHNREQAEIVAEREMFRRQVADLKAKIARLAGLDDSPAPAPAPQPVAPPAPVLAKVNGNSVSPAVAKWQAANVKA